MASEQWVLIRGLGRSAFHWHGFAEKLMKARPGAQCVMVELPGNGALNGAPTDVHPDLAVRKLRDQARGHFATGRLHLLGISLGGMLALYWASVYADEVAHVAVINTSLTPFSRLNQRLQVSAIMPLLRAILSSSEVERERIIYQLTSNRSDGLEPLIAANAAWSELHPVSKLNIFRQLLLAHEIALPNRPAPELTILASTFDRLVSVECSRGLARAWQLPVAEHPWAGHDLPIDDPQWILENLPPVRN